METQKPVIAGATGFVGTDLRKFLNEQNINMVSLSRKKYQPFDLEETFMYSDLTNKTLVQKLKGCNVLIHLVGIGAQTINSDYQSVNVEQTKKLIDLCKHLKINKIIYISGLGVSKSTTFSYFISKLKAEQQIIKSGLDYTILRASYIIGKNDPLTKNLQRQIKSGSIIIPGSGSYRLQPISVRDVTRVILSCMENKKLSNKIIDLVGPQTLTFEEFVKKFTRGMRIKIQKISLEKAYHMALNNPKIAFYGLDDLSIMVGDFISDHKRLEKLCGFNLKTLDGL